MPTEPTRDLEITRSLDCSGKLCPMPIYMASKTLASMKAGEILEVKCTDASSINDFPGFAERSGHALLATKQLDGKVFLFYLRRGDG